MDSRRSQPSRPSTSQRGKVQEKSLIKCERGRKGAEEGGGPPPPNSPSVAGIKRDDDGLFLKVREGKAGRKGRQQQAGRILG